MSGEDRFDELFSKYYPKLMIYATRFLDEENAEDIVQDVFLELWERRSQIEMGDYIVSFLYRSTYSKCLNFIKHDQIVKGYGENQAKLFELKMEYFQPDSNETMKRLESEEMRESINGAINELPEKCREVFCMSYLNEMKNKEIADFMDISLRTVEAHMYKALKYLRDRLKIIELIIVYLFLFSS